MEVLASSKYLHKLSRINKKNKSITEKIKEKLSVFRDNKESSSLRLHKLEGDLHGFWSISIEQDLRIIFSYTKNGILLLDIGKHEDVY